MLNPRKNFLTWLGSQLSIEDIYNLLFEAANDAIFFMNQNQFIDCNLQSVTLFGGKRKEDILEISPWELSPTFQPDGQLSKDKALTYISLAASGKPQRFYWKHRKIDGTLFDAEISLNSITINNDVFIHSMVRDITAYLETERALRESERKYKCIFENIQDVFYQTDKNGKITLVSPSISKYTSHQHDKLIGTSVIELYKNKSEREKLLQLLEKDGQVNDFEIELIAGPNHYILASVNAHLVFDENNEFAGIEGSLRDITDRRNAHNEVVRERIMLRTLIDNIPDTVYVKDVLGRKIIANKADLVHTNKDEEGDVIGKTDLELFPGPHGQYGYSEDLNVINSQKPLIDNSSTFVDSQGCTHWLRTSKIPLFDADGICMGLVGIGHDITADVEAGIALRNSEEKYRTLIESIPDGVYRSTADGRFLEANQSLVSLLGYSSKEELFKIDIKKELYFDEADRESAVLLEKHEEMAVYPLRKKDGTKIWVEDHGWLKTDEQGEVLFHEGVLRDVTERHAFQLQLQQYTSDLKTANDTKDKLFSIIAHDLLSPFNAMLGFTTLLADHPDDLTEAEQKELMDRLKSTAENTYSLLEKLLTWSRSQRGKIIVQKVDTSLWVLVNEVCTVLADVASRKQIVIKNVIDPAINIYADPSMTNVVVYNLCVNALKYSFQGGIVTISAVHHQHEVVVMVADTGVGMSNNQVDTLFDPGAGKSTPGTDNEKGTGLGLIICKEFVEKQGGEIWITSELKNGTTFFFSLPNGSK